MTQLHAAILLRQGQFELDVNLDVPSGAITALLGPSGSGKTTVLRVLAGLQRPSNGYLRCADDIWYDAKRGLWKVPQRRQVGVVFQDYALFDHYTVAQNIGYGVPAAQRQTQVHHWLNRLHLTGVAGHYPAQLSGGQRQRTALGRALAIEPRLLLLDEPFSAVDFAFRHRLRVELRELVERAQYPILLVSHDLDEVRQLAAQVYVMDEGQVLQSGPTEEVFAQPLTRRVAEIVGWKNLLPVRLLRAGIAQGAWGAIEVPAADDRGGWLGVRPEHLSIAPQSAGLLRATLRHISDLGAVRELTCVTDDGTHLYILQTWRNVVPHLGEQVKLHAAPQHLRYWPEDEQMMIAETHTV
ncbi:MAG: ABC transporter ATP-binding protein [Gammaproteobacteria bacterium]|nr:ABC transporter ATP-binding protein [Gammaproteobacteria bacterium]